MSFPNISDLAATTLEFRSKSIADNVTKNNALLAYLNKGGRVKSFSGGTKIYQELNFAENANAGWYSGYDPLPTAAQDVISAAEYGIKQAAVAVTMSGLEELQNSGSQQVLDLLESRIEVAEASMMNLIAAGVYSDGTGAGGKQIGGLDAAIPVANTTGTYGGINRATYTFWRHQVRTAGSAITTSTVQTEMNAMYANLVRGTDRPNLIVMDPVWWQTYLASLQTIQRFTDPSSANLGFPTVKYMDTDVVLDGGIGGFATTKTAYWLNTKYLFWRPHSRRNMVPLSPNKRYSTNQDAVVQLLAWAGNLTASGMQFQGRSITP